MTRGFFRRLEERVDVSGSLLCVGLDPRVETPQQAVDECRLLIEKTGPQVAAFKANSAFFEALGPGGLEALAEVIAAVPDGIPVLLDAKRGDISSSARAYAAAAFDRLGAGAVTVNPYMGTDSVEPFLDHADKGVFVLCRTSNLGGTQLQESRLASGEPVFLDVARAFAGWPEDRVGFVVGATAPDAVRSVRSVAPNHWILAPGVGAQGGSLSETLTAGLRADGSGVLMPVSRAVATSADPASAVAELNDAMRLVRASPRPPASRGGLEETLFQSGCVRFGEFKLKSGRSSPIYLDLRTLLGYPELLRRIAARYVPLLGDAERIAGVPLAGMPIATAVSMQSGIPLVVPRSEVKQHGTGAAVEGPFEPGDNGVVVDDVATSGSSILGAVARLRQAGMNVSAAVVLIDRGEGAAAALVANGIELRSVLRLPQLVELLRDSGHVTSSEAARVLEYLGPG